MECIFNSLDSFQTELLSLNCGLNWPSKAQSCHSSQETAGCLVTTFILIWKDWTNSTLLLSECWFFQGCQVPAWWMQPSAVGWLQVGWMHKGKHFSYFIFIMSSCKKIFFFPSMGTNRHWNNFSQEESCGFPNTGHF